MITAGAVTADLQSLRGDLMDIAIFIDSLADIVSPENRQDLADCAWRITQAAGHVSWVHGELRATGANIVTVRTLDALPGREQHRVARYVLLASGA